MIIFSPKAYQKIKYFVRSTEDEISGLGKSKIIDNHRIVIQDIEILNQENGGSHTILEEKAMAEFINDKIRNDEDIVSWNVWWHSHANFGTFWSNQDETTIEETTGAPYLISIVTNRDLNMLSRIDFFKPLRLTMNLDVFKSKGRPRESKKYLIQYCERKIKKCIKTTIGFDDRWNFSTQKNSKNLSQLSVQEILDQQWPMD